MSILHCRAQAGQTHVFRVDQVVNEDAGLEFAYNYTAHNLVKTVRRQGGSGTFISLGLPRSGKTFMMEVRLLLPSVISSGVYASQHIRAVDMSHAEKP